jgi:prepilin-type N-terminal cleavage/methylation domain-containing protein
MKRSPVSIPSANVRRGFTLVELLAVITILSILIALLLPAIFGARRNALIVQVTSDITTLDNAIKAFKNEFGMEPPSQITLFETANQWSPASQAVIGRLWPQFDFTLNRDFNLDGNISGSVTLYGAECLVFFLGGATTYVDANSNGVYDSSETVITVNGFSKNPADPFAPIAAGVTATGNRLGPFYQFNDQNRLISAQTNSNGISFTFSYGDPISGRQVPYLYLSSYDGQGYNANDLGTLPDNLTNGYYLNGTSASSPAWNPTGYQIISAGFDRRYGGPATLGAGPYPFAGPWQKGFQFPANRDAERDNITNFSNGLLSP